MLKGESALPPRGPCGLTTLTKPPNASWPSWGLHKALTESALDIYLNPGLIHSSQCYLYICRLAYGWLARTMYVLRKLYQLMITKYLGEHTIHVHEDLTKVVSNQPNKSDE